MKQALPVIDNITDILHVVLQFTHSRHKVLTNNIKQADNPHHYPNDLPAATFSLALDEALDELSNNRRILWRDLDFMSFEHGGQMTFYALPDPKGHYLKQTDSDAYLRYQTKRLLENELNQKITMKLLSRHQTMPTSLTA